MALVRAFQIARTAFVIATLAGAAHAGTFQVLYTFHGYPARDGANPESAPIMDSRGDLYGTTSAGGASACGIVYKLHKQRGVAWKETILYSFQCGVDAAYPTGGLIMDKSGNLFGGTPLGGTGECYFYGERIGCGAIYKLSPAKHGAWTETVLYSFPAPIGGFFDGPEGSLTFDRKGILYGATVYDNPCPDDWGSVFRLKAVNGKWKEKDVYDFCGAGDDGRSPGYEGLVFDPAGNIYGTTIGGGDGNDHGVIFELSPQAHNQWRFTKIYQFTQDEGGDLQGGLTLDAAGNLYGAEYAGGNNVGAIFELSPSGGGKWKESILYSFLGGGSDGEDPWQPPVFDSSGNLWGTTQQGGVAQYCLNCGVIYELVPQGGGKWSESIVYNFGSQPNVTDGSDPIGGLTRGEDGNFYGATLESGDPSCGGCGVVFEFTP